MSFFKWLFTASYTAAARKDIEQIIKEKESNGLYTPNCIRTFGGIYVNVFNPTVDMIDINDIAHALAHQCRFSGHTSSFYSVAQHSILCAELVDEELKLPALLHDAPEAYLIDVPSPIKHKLKDFKKIENNVMQAISKKFNISFPLNKKIKEADEVMLKREWEQLMIREKQHFECLSPLEAKKKFLDVYHNITKKH